MSKCCTGNDRAKTVLQNMSKPEMKFLKITEMIKMAEIFEV